MSTFTEIVAAKNEVVDHIRDIAASHANAKGVFSSLSSRLTSISSQYGWIVSESQTMAAANPTNATYQNLAEEIGQHLADFSALQAAVTASDQLLNG